MTYVKLLQYTVIAILDFLLNMEEIMLSPDVINELTDLRYLTWSHARYSSGTAGSYLKAYEIRNGKKLYYKLSCFDPEQGITGHECVNEVIVDRLLQILGVEHIHYQLIHALVLVNDEEYETYVCVSEDFKEPGDSKAALDDYYDMEHDPGESRIDFCVRKGWKDYIYTMLVVDYLILNRDRHGANIEVLRNRVNETVRPAPLFDHGLSLIFSCKTDEEVKNFDPMSDPPVQSYIGSRSAAENLKLIPSNSRPSLRELEERDKKILFSGLDEALPEIYRDKIWEMIWKRWCSYENM